VLIIRQRLVLAEGCDHILCCAVVPIWRAINSYEFILT
jgi:hypothetical protein